MQIKSVAVGSAAYPVAKLAVDLGLDYARTDWEHRDPTAATDWEHGVPAEQLWWDSYVVQAESLAEARGLLPLFRSEGRAHRFVLVIRGLFPADEVPAWTPGSLQAKAGTAALTVPGLGLAVVVEGGKWVNVHAAALAALRCASPANRPPVLGGLRVGFTEPAELAWLAGDTLGSFMTEALLQPEPDDIYSVDVMVGDSKLTQKLGGHIPVHPGRVTPPVWTPTETVLPPVDTAVVSPMGFLPYPEKPARPLEPFELAGGVLHESDLAALRPHDYLVVDGSRFGGLDGELARRLSQLAVAGVPLLARNLAAPVRTLLGDQLLEHLDAFDAADPPVVRESKSIGLRRTALDLYSPKGVWNTVLGELGKPLLPLPSVSVVLATRRPEKLASALEQLAGQSWKSVEVVVVLHGFDAEHPAVRRAVQTYQGELLVRSVPADMIFGEVLNAGVNAASGDLVCKMDDDDWYGPHHLRDLVHAKDYSGATLVGSQVEFVYLESLDITTRRPPLGEQYSDHVAGGTMMLGRGELRQLGGWRPVHRAVDRCLLQAVQAAGGLIYRSHGQNYMMHRHSGADSHGGHTWNPEDGTFLQSVAEQWDGFRPPPQIGPGQGTAAGARLEGMRSHFAGVPATVQHSLAPLPVRKFRSK
ncbi:glycosyltransferase family 2 protein [uncultured Arthrobacter sp.]|uniref:glycosyltransferase family 2 protein n=1 Tax=uncultured Arthrobacter sp. TaxID=114050 RepID=UPI00321652C0